MTMTDVQRWLILGGSILLCVFLFARPFGKFAPQDPVLFSESIHADPDLYIDVESVVEDKVALHAYDFTENQYVKAFDKSSRLPELADSNGRVPVFKFDSDLFFVLNKRVSFSSGLAFSKNSKFKSKLETMDGRFSVSHVKGEIYSWRLNLNKNKG